ncbi:MAG: TlpA family protein disulfide reductase [Pseudomonadota bacterium]|nr:TlpA family protein disulfide reductase [Pseudomonadota bacterium]
MARLSATARIVIVAVLAGVLGVAVGLAFNGGGPLMGPLLRTEPGQRMLQRVVALDAPDAPVGVEIATRGSAIPSFALPALDGSTVTLPDAYAGRPILINFWASWCGPCIVEMPELDRFADSQDAIGTQVIGIALDRPEEVRSFLRHTRVDYPILIDTPGPADTSVRMGNPRGVLPYTVLIGTDGRLLKQKIGPFVHGEIDGWAGRPRPN